MAKFPYVTSYSEVVKVCKEAHTNAAHRPGQAVCNKYQLPKKLEDSVYEEKDATKVYQRIWNHFNPSQFQG